MNEPIAQKTAGNTKVERFDSSEETAPAALPRSKGAKTTWEKPSYEEINTGAEVTQYVHKR